jgi:hypothetical protein
MLLRRRATTTERFKRTVIGAGALLGALLLPWPALAQQSADALSKEAANPVADLISLPFQNNTDFGLGPYFPVPDQPLRRQEEGRGVAARPTGELRRRT